MRGGPLSAQWEDEPASRTAMRADPDAGTAQPESAPGRAEPGQVMDRPGLDGEAARRLGLFAYNVARTFFPYRPDLVEEAVQETLTRTCERWERANQRGCPEAWVVNTATNVCQEKIRQEQRGARCSGEPVHLDHEEDLVRSELLADALRRLTKRQRLVIVWRYLFDFSVTDTAGALGLTDSKVRDASHNGVRRLRRILGDEWSELT